MAAIVWADVSAFAPNLATAPAGVQADVLAYVNAALNPAMFDGEAGPTYRIARIYLAAHAGTLAAQGASGAGGPITQESAGRLSRSYAMPGGGVAFDALDSTLYGKMYRQLLRQSSARGPWVLNGDW